MKWEKQRKMSKQYYFDKRVMKRFFLRYGLMFLVALPILIGLSYPLEKVASATRIIIYLAILVVLVVLCEVINRALVKRAERKEEERRLAEKQAKKQNRKKKTNK